MRAVDLIQKKRDGYVLNNDEIEFFIAEYNRGNIPDYQAAALLMAVYFKGMKAAETAALTHSLAESGESIDFTGIEGLIADKHSTGGVGDKTTLVLMPLVASAGVKVAKFSGRGLGHTGGTIDKLACIPGFKTNLNINLFMSQVGELGLAVTGQSPQMVPADGKLYALRDVTATVDSIPLIASSIMSKKVASGAGSIVLDVKVGRGAFMQERSQALELAEVMVAIGKNLGRRTVALITAMDQPLGRSVGNHLELLEAIEALRGEGPSDLTDLSLRLGAEMLVLTGHERETEAAVEALRQRISDGSALNMLRRWISAQGGDATIVDSPQKLGSPNFSCPLNAEKDGYLAVLDAAMVGRAAMLLGAGREKKDDDIDLLAGIRLNAKCGDKVSRDQIVAIMYAGSKEKIERAKPILEQAFIFSERPVQQMPLILDRID